MEFTEQIPYFLQQYLGKPASALPKNALWVANFQGVDLVKPAILKTATLEQYGNTAAASTGSDPNNPETGSGWNVAKGLDVIIEKYLKNNNKGCFFVQAVSVPGESMVANPEGIQQQNLLRTAVGGGRDAYTGLQMTFLDTNVSFVDSVIRPWVLTTARLGMKARSDANQQYRAIIEVYKLGIYSPDKPPAVLQKYTFHGACPISVTSEEYNYIAATSPINREVVFNFHYYTFEVLPSEVTGSSESYFASNTPIDNTLPNNPSNVKPIQVQLSGVPFNPSLGPDSQIPKYP